MTFGVSKTPKVFDHLRGFKNLEGFYLTIDFLKIIVFAKERRRIGFTFLCDSPAVGKLLVFARLFWTFRPQPLHNKIPPFFFLAVWSSTGNAVFYFGQFL